MSAFRQCRARVAAIPAGSGVPTCRGFTLIELMTVVVVVAILLAVAVPAYNSQIRKTRRVDAQSVLLEAAQFMERNYTNCNRYDKMPAGGNCDTNSALPAGLQAAPKDGATKYYNLSIQAVGQTTYTLRATPQSAGGQNQDSCGNLEINQLGVKSPSTGDCWR